MRSERMYTQENYGIHQGTPYGSLYSPEDTINASKSLMQPPFQCKRKRINVISTIIALFVPWLVFCGIASLWSFSLRYTSPALTWVITLAVGVPLGLLTIYSLYQTYTEIRRGQYQVVETGHHAAWTLFILITCCVAFVLALCLGVSNYQQSMRGNFDVSALSSYTGVNPATMRGQELMDAGKVTFVDGADLDLRYANGFRNTDVYCVAPITVNNAVLASYDFWAVGKNCCSDDKPDFKCGDISHHGSMGGVRIVSDTDRDFYRLAVQQSSSAHAIKAIHPLFFRWTSDPAEEQEALERVGYQWILAGMLGYFMFQLILVVLALTCFTKLRLE